jgi:hypothetical protein
MELNNTRCHNCGHVSTWYSYKFANTKDKQEWNRINRETCPECKSDNVSDFDNEITMGAYDSLADELTSDDPYQGRRSIDDNQYK